MCSFFIAAFKNLFFNSSIAFMDSEEFSLYFEKSEVAGLYAPSIPNGQTFADCLVADNYDVAILGVRTDNASLANVGTALAPNSIRQYLYALRGGFKQIKIADLGNIRPGKSDDETKLALKAVAEDLAKRGVVIIVLGGSQDLTSTIFDGIKFSMREVNVAVIDSRADFMPLNSVVDSSNYMTKIANDKMLQSIDFIAYQSYYIGETMLSDLIEKNYISPKCRLGQVRQNLKGVEPVLRDSDLVSVDMSVVRQSDAPGNLNPSPNGLFGEEACQLMRMAGCSDRVKALGLFEVNPQADNNGQTANLAAQMIWHFVEALDNRCGDYPKQSIDAYKRFVVPIGEKTAMNFFYGKLRDRWWIEVPMQDETRIIACSEDDYRAASKGQTPEVWFRYYMK